MNDEFILNWRVGLRTACLIVQVASRFASHIEICRKGQKVNATDITGIVLLFCKCRAGARFRLAINGSDAETAMQVLRELFTVGPRQGGCLHDGCPSAAILLSYSADKIVYGCSKYHEWEFARRGCGWPSPETLRTLVSDCGAISSQPPTAPPKGSFPWPGRERLSHRDRLLLESRNFKELIDATGSVPGNLESSLGYLEYLLMDWEWLRSPKHQAEPQKYSSYHSWHLRSWPEYAKNIQWQGKIPTNDSALESWTSFYN